MAKTLKKLLAVILAASMTMSMVSFTSLAAEEGETEESNPSAATERPTYCRLEEHTHGDECYEMQHVLICEQEEVSPHEHSEECYVNATELICKIPENHQHDPSTCYAFLTICRQTESEEHPAHTEECYEEGNLICGYHVHVPAGNNVPLGETSGCYQYMQICPVADRDLGHTHVSGVGGCYRPTCGQEATDGHTHGETCYEDKSVLTCTKQIHTHTDECYFEFVWDAETKTLTINGTGELTSEVVKNYVSKNGAVTQAQHVIVSEGVTAIGERAFNLTNFAELKEVRLPDTLTSIGAYAFYNRKKLTSVNFPAGLTNIGRDAFNGTALEKVEISVTGSLAIGQTAFKAVPASVISVASEIPNGVTFGSGVFMTTAKAESIYIHNAADIGAVFASTGAQALVIDGANSIGASVVTGAKNLTTVTLKNVNEVKLNAFKGVASITDVTLENIGIIGVTSFMNCTGLTSVTMSNVETINKNAFQDCTALTNLNVPGNTQLSYVGSYPEVMDRMQAIFADQFVMGEAQEIDRLAPEGDWDDTKTDENKNWNSYEDQTQLMALARWTNEDKTEAKVEVDAYYTAKEQMDFIFVADLSPSMEELGNPNDANSRFYDMQSKLLDVTDKLLTAGAAYDCRVAVVGFSAPKRGVTIEDALKTLAFSNDVGTVKAFINGLTPLRGDTDYGLGMKTALELIQGNQGRNMTVIFLSDGAPNSSKGSGDMAGTINAGGIKAVGVPIYGVLHSPAATSAAKAEAAMNTLCNKVFKADDTTSFGRAMNDAFTAVYGDHIVTIPVNPAFENVSNPATSNPDDAVTVENGTITWTITGMPFTKHTLTYEMSLTAENAAQVGEKSYLVNNGNASIAGGVSVESPVLTRTVYTVTYTDGVEDAEIFADQSTNVLAGKPTPAFVGTPTRSGYTFTGWSPEVAETVTGNVIYTAQWSSDYVPPTTTYYTLTINYVDGEGNAVADRYTSRQVSGSSYSVTSPAVEGMTPDQETVSGTLTSNLTVTVVYAEDVEETDTPTTETPEVTETPDPVETREPDETQPPETEEPEEVEELGETDTPLTEAPEETEETEELGEGETPLAEVPQTGDLLWLWILLAVTSAAGLIWISLEEKKGKRVA